MDKLQMFSIQEIHATYKVLSKKLQEYLGIKKRCHIPDGIDVQYTDDNNILILHFNNDVKYVLAQIDFLDKEINRRNNLIGVVG